MSTSKKHIKLKDLNIKNTGFGVPDYYFDSLETKILSKVNDDIPTNYFEDIENKILSKLNIDNSKNVKVIKLNSKLFKRLIPIVAAASVVLFIGLNFLKKANTLNFNSIDITSISNWVELNSDDSNAYVLGEYLSPEELTSISNTNISNIKDADLVEYLNDTNLEDLMINN